MITIYLKQYNKIIRNADPDLFDELGFDDILWIDLLEPSIKEQKAVENFMELSLQTKQQVEEIESTSKYSETENAIISNSNFFVPQGESFTVEDVPQKIPANIMYINALFFIICYVNLYFHRSVVYHIKSACIEMRHIRIAETARGGKSVFIVFEVEYCHTRVSVDK